MITRFSFSPSVAIGSCLNRDIEYFALRDMPRRSFVSLSCSLDGFKL